MDHDFVEAKVGGASELSPRQGSVALLPCRLLLAVL